MKKSAVSTICAIFMLTGLSLWAQTVDFFKLVQNGSPDEVQAAIAKGADLGALNKDGYTALVYAAAFNQNPAVIEVLQLRLGRTLPPRIFWQVPR